VKRFATPLMLAVATSASIALSIPLGALLGVPWGGLAAGLLGGGGACLYQLSRNRRPRHRGPYCKLCRDYGCPTPHQGRPAPNPFARPAGWVEPTYEPLTQYGPLRKYGEGQATRQPEAHPTTTDTTQEN
jgi:hypothetical protein